MATSTVTMTAKRDAVKFTTLVNGKRRTIFFDALTTTQFFAFLMLRGTGSLSKRMAGLIDSYKNSKTYSSEVVELSYDEFVIARRLFFKDLTSDNFWKVSKTTKSNGQYGYVTIS